MKGRKKAQELLTQIRRRREGGEPGADPAEDVEEEKVEQEHQPANPGGRSSASKPEPRPSTGQAKAQISFTSSTCRSWTWTGVERTPTWVLHYRQEEWKPQEWKNKGVKKTETQRYFKAFLAHKRGR